MRSRPTQHEPFGTRAYFAILAGLGRSAMNVLLSRRWIGFDRVPDGCIIVSNHMTEIDPIVVGHALYSNGKYPRFLAKQSLFKLPVIGALLTRTGQIPVDRGGPGAGTSLETARSQLDRGSVIVVYPEGTLTRDPDLWPMRGHTGAARLALKTGVPVVPVVHWGDEQLFPRYGRMIHPFPRKRTVVKVGEPIDLADLREGPTTRTALIEATDRIIRSLTQELATLRGGTPPEHPWDPAKDGAGEAGRRNTKQHATPDDAAHGKKHDDGHEGRQEENA